MKNIIAAMGLVTLLATPCLAEYPDHPIHIVVPFPPGGGGDLYTRLLAERLTAKLGQPVVVDNRPGAGGTLGTGFVAHAAPDGYTLEQAGSSFITVAPSLYNNLPYDPLKDFAPIALVATSPAVLVVNPKLPVHTVKELIVYAKDHAGQLNYSSSGIGGAGHLGGAMFSEMAGIKAVHVPYQGSAPSLVGILGDEAQFSFPELPVALPYIKNNQLRGIAVAGASRTPLLPEIPTVSESGLPGFQDDALYGLVAPAGTSPDIIRKLNTAVIEIARDPDFQKKLLDIGANVVDFQRFGTSPEKFGAYLKADIARWKTVVTKANIHIN